MRALIKLALASAVALGLVDGALAAEFSEGTVKNVDVNAKKVTLIHEELKDLEMPAMTMVFRVQDGTLMDKLWEGASVEFIAERVDGTLTVTQAK
ncbi:copper-binding protein [Ensifer sp. LC163]|uniref:copper-binding protein n=1 Tax=Ensifer sp. LC163 TaxID=1120652 RepID=UPI000813B8C7|nr:copper-binding protein [Ensifer sp. LC163]OCP15667.1 hypothetical protein BC360_15435 [Ensifer sp. LC163]